MSKRVYTREQMIRCYKDAINNVGQYIQNWREPMPTAEKYVDSLDAKFGDQQVVGMGSFPADPIDVFEAPSFPNFDGVDKQTFEHLEVKMVHHKEVYTPSLFAIPSKPTKGIAVDCGSVSGKNPGIFEYRLVDIETKTVIINVVIDGETTNNIAEFLAAVHGVGHCKANQIDLPVYSDSLTARSWIRKKAMKTTFNVTDEFQKAQIEEALKYIKTLTKAEQPQVWDTVAWGEIPADYGNKN